MLFNSISWSFLFSHMCKKLNLKSKQSRRNLQPIICYDKNSKFELIIGGLGMGTNKPVTMTVETTVHAPIGKCGSIERSQST